MAEDQAGDGHPRLRLVPDAPAEADVDSTSGDFRAAMERDRDQLRAAFPGDALAAAFAPGLPAMRRAFPFRWQ